MSESSKPKRSRFRSESKSPKSNRRYLDRAFRSLLAVCLASGLMIPVTGYAVPAEGQGSIPESAGSADGGVGANLDSTTSEGVTPEDDPAEETDGSETESTGSLDGDESQAKRAHDAPLDGEHSDLSNGNDGAPEFVEEEKGLDTPELQPSASAPQSLHASLSTSENAALSADALQQAQDQGLVIEGTAVVDYIGSGGEVVIPEGITEIGENAFAGSSVGPVFFSDSLSLIRDRAFYNCDMLVNLALPSGVVIEGSPFSYCDALSHVWIPNDIQYGYDSGWGPFCRSGNSVVFELESGMTTIPAGLFRDANCAEITLPESIEEISDQAFYGSSIEQIDFPGCLKTIGELAFADCEELVEVDLPEGVTTLDGGAFTGCPSLEHVTIPSTLTTANKSAVYYPFSDTSGNAIAFELSEGATCVPANLFGRANIKAISIPDTVTEIGASAFYGAVLPASFSLPNGVTTIGEYAFWGCNFERLEIFHDVDAAPYGFGAATISDLVISEGVTAIPSEMFTRSSIESISFPTSLKTIGDEAFLNVSDLTTLVLPEGFESLGAYSFQDCEDLTSVHIPATLKTAGYYESGDSWYFAQSPFDSCSSIATITFGEGITSIPAILFQDAWIKEVTIPDTVEEIGDRAFATHTLENIYVSASVETFGENAIGGNALVHCPEGSAAHAYAVENDLNYTFDFVHTTHVWSDWFVDDEPTCTDPGLERRECTCGAYEEREIDALGHSFGEWIIDKQPTLLEAGHQYRRCERCTEIEEQEIPKLTADPDEHPDYALATLHVVDATTLANIEGATVSLKQQDADEGAEPVVQTLSTNADGNVQFFIPSGTYYIQVEKDGYQLRGFEYELAAGESTLPDIGIATESLVQSSLTVEEMTKDEIVDAGIDMNAPGNEHIFKWEVTLTFSDGLEIYEIPSITYKNENGDEVGGFFGGVPISEAGPTTVEVEVGDREPVLVCRVSEMLYIVIQGEAKWLKEMFHVQLLAVNISQTDEVVDAVAQLQLPEGVSLADMTTGEQSLTHEIGTMATGEQKTVDWYIRGDATGDYTLTATLSGEMQPFGDSFTYTYQNEDPLHVYAGTDMKLTVHIDDAAYYEEPYTMYFELENISDHTICNVTHEITNISQYEVKEYVWLYDGEVVDSEEVWTQLESHDVGPEGRIKREEFKPGESLWIKASTRVLWESPLQSLVNTAEVVNKVSDVLPLLGITMPAAYGAISSAASLISSIDVRYWLNDTMVSTLEGSTTTIPVEFDINHVSGISIFDKFAEELLGFSPDDKEEIVEEVGSQLVSIIFGEEAADVSKFIYDETKSYAKVLADDETTECWAWVEEVEGSDVLAITESGSGVRALSNGGSSGELAFTGSAEIEVEALNPGVADLVVKDSDGNIARKRYVVRAKLPAQERFIPSGADLLELDYAPLPGGTVLDEDTAAMYEQLGIALYASGDAEALPVEVGSTIPTGATLRSDVSSANVPILVPGDVNSDGLVDEADAVLMETPEAADVMTEQQKVAGDLTGDGIVDAADAEYLRAYLSGVENPDEPDPGPDPVPGPGPEPGPGTDSDPDEPVDPGTDPDDPVDPDIDPDQPEDSDGPAVDPEPDEPSVDPDEDPSVDDPSETLDQSKQEAAAVVDELIEKIEQSDLSDEDKASLIDEAEALRGALENATDPDEIDKILAGAAALTKQLENPAESGETTKEEQPLKELETADPNDSGSDKDSKKIVATGDVAVPVVGAVLSLLIASAFLAVVSRKRMR